MCAGRKLLHSKGRESIFVTLAEKEPILASPHLVGKPSNKRVCPFLLFNKGPSTKTHAKVPNHASRTDRLHTERRSASHKPGALLCWKNYMETLSCRFLTSWVDWPKNVYFVFATKMVPKSPLAWYEIGNATHTLCRWVRTSQGSASQPTQVLCRGTTHSSRPSQLERK